MCGLFGFSGKAHDYSVLQRFMQVLAIETSERGTDATGFAAMEGDNFWMSKAPVNAAKFVFHDADFNACFEQHKPQLMIGHCRLATHGDKANPKNNHPHVSKDRSLAIVHNGIVYAHNTLAELNNLTLHGECDSEAILRLCEIAIPANENKCYDKLVDVAQTLEDFGAMFSVLVLDRKRRCIWTLRNFSNPLVYWRSEQLGVTVFASELDHIHKAAQVVLGKRVRKSVAGFSPNPGRVFRFKYNGSEPSISRREAKCEGLSAKYNRYAGAFNNRTSRWNDDEFGIMGSYGSTTYDDTLPLHDTKGNIVKHDWSPSEQRMSARHASSCSCLACKAQRVRDISSSTHADDCSCSACTMQRTVDRFDAHVDSMKKGAK